MRRCFGVAALVLCGVYAVWAADTDAATKTKNDRLNVKVTVAGRAQVTDPVAFITAVQDTHGALYLAVQVALREVVAAHTVEEILAGRAELGLELVAAVRGIEEIGVAVADLGLKDVILPPDLKRAQAEVLVARAQGLAALERARGETAALRSLANAARQAEGSPALLQLRLLQLLAATPGHPTPSQDCLRERRSGAAPSRPHGVDHWRLAARRARASRERPSEPVSLARARLGEPETPSPCSQ